MTFLNGIERPLEEIIGTYSIEEIAVEDASRIYQKARSAHLKWRSISMFERLSFLKVLRIYMAEHLDEVVEVITKDTGKVNMDALVADIMPTLDALAHIEKHAHHILGKQKKKTSLLFFGKRSYVEYQPVGVVLIISPWNYPLQLAMVPVISAVISGNAVILKPSEMTPYVGKLIEVLIEKAGFPSDVIQVAHGDGKLGEALVNHQPDYIFFTGSVKTGKIIQAQAAKQLIPTTLELGGKDPFIVFSDANINRATKAAVWGAFTNSGQVCMGTERLYVEKDVYPKMMTILKEEIRQLKQGEEDENDVGAMTTKMQWEIVKLQVEEALSKGAKIEVGVPPQEWEVSDKWMIPPLLLTDVTHNMKIMKEETFGPVLPVMTFETEEEAVALANDSKYGLNASVWSSNINKAESVAAQITSGAVVINDVIITVGNHYLPFGGAKSSGMGRYHAEIGLRTFCNEKSVMVDKGRRLNEVQWYPYEKRDKLFSQLLQNLYGRKRQWGLFLLNYIKLLKRHSK